MTVFSEEALVQIIQGGETNTVELKRAAPRATEMAECLCGMANAQGGMVIIGVEDASHEIVGVPDTRIGETLDVILRATRQMIKPELVLYPPDPEWLCCGGQKSHCGNSQTKSWTRVSGAWDLLGTAWNPYRVFGSV